LKLKYGEPLSNFAFNVKSRRYYLGESQHPVFGKVVEGMEAGSVTRPLFQLNISRFGHTSLCPPV
jgi:hypothetical protein